MQKLTLHRDAFNNQTKARRMHAAQTGSGKRDGQKMIPRLNCLTIVTHFFDKNPTHFNVCGGKKVELQGSLTFAYRRLLHTHTHCPTMSITTSRKQRLALQFSKEKTNIVFFVFATKCSACDAQFGEEALYHRFPFP